MAAKMNEVLLVSKLKRELTSSRDRLEGVRGSSFPGLTASNP